MLDTYDFDGDVWLCHSFQGHCHDFTAFVCKFIHLIYLFFINLCFHNVWILYSRLLRLGKDKSNLTIYSQLHRKIGCT